jgi:tRNA(fMet)-specific endonuclease VapC
VAVKIALDTNAYSDFMRGNPSRVQSVQMASELYLPVIVVGELRGGFLRGRYARENEADLQRFLNVQRVSVIDVDEETTHFYAHTYESLRKGGTLIPTNDIWIAALVLQHGLVLCTSDAHFRHVPHLPTC